MARGEARRLQRTWPAGRRELVVHGPGRPPTPGLAGGVLSAGLGAVRRGYLSAISGLRPARAFGPRLSGPPQRALLCVRRLASGGGARRVLGRRRPND